MDNSHLSLVLYPKWLCRLFPTLLPDCKIPSGYVHITYYCWKKEWGADFIQTCTKQEGRHWQVEHWMGHELLGWRWFTDLTDCHWINHSFMWPPSREQNSLTAKYEMASQSSDQLLKGRVCRDSCQLKVRLLIQNPMMETICSEELKITQVT